MGQRITKPIYSDAAVNAAVRQVCAMAAGFGKTEAVLEKTVNELVTGDVLARDVGIEQLRRAIEWNQARDYIRFERDDDTGEIQWFITRAGIAKESIK